MKYERVAVTYADLRQDCLDTIRHWPGCESVVGIQIIRDNRPGGFSVRVTLYGAAEKKLADRAIKSVEREKRRQFGLIE